MKPLQKNLLSLQPLVLALSLAFSAGSHAANPGLFNMNTIGGAGDSDVEAIAPDGSIAAGSIESASGAFHIFTWSNGLMTDLQPNETGFNYTVKGMSNDGSVIAGFGGPSGSAFRFQAGVVTPLLPFGTDQGSFAFGISGDGSTVVGESCPSSNTSNCVAVEWLASGTAATMLPALGLVGLTSSQASGANKDGSVVVGTAIAGTLARAVYWTGGTAYDLGSIAEPPGQLNSNSGAAAVSPDGKHVVGASDVTVGGLSHATLWNVATPTAPTVTDLGSLKPNGNSVGLAVSANGKVVVGQADSATNVSGLAAFRWTQATGMQTIEQWLSNNSVSMPTGWELMVANGVNQDGSIVVGNGRLNGQNEAWLARVSTDADNSGSNPGQGSGATTGTGIINIDSFNASVAEAGIRAIQAGIGLPNMAMFGAHHRSILDSGLARSVNGACAWSTMDASGNNRSDTRAQLIEAGVCKDIGSARIGVGIGQAWSQQDWSLNGSARFNGRYLILEGTNAFDNGLQPSITAYYGNFNTTMDRHYVNGGGIDSSSANPDARSYAVRARLDWKDAARVGKFNLSPYVAYTWMRTQLDAYTETGGGFPARFAASGWSTNDLRAGTLIKTSLSASTDLQLGLEAVHRADGNTGDVNGQVIGLWSFSLPGQSVNQNWARATLDIDNRLNDSTLFTAGVNLATPGGDATWGVTAGLRMNF